MPATLRIRSTTFFFAQRYNVDTVQVKKNEKRKLAEERLEPMILKITKAQSYVSFHFLYVTGALLENVGKWWAYIQTRCAYLFICLFYHCFVPLVITIFVPAVILQVNAGKITYAYFRRDLKRVWGRV